VLVTQKERDVAPLGLAMSTMQDSRVTLRIGQNGAEELTPPGQAILVRGTETLTVMAPYLPDDERAQRLNSLRWGEIELSDAQREKRVLQAARGTRASSRLCGACMTGSKEGWGGCVKPCPCAHCDIIACVV
jgi:hypothetical protein